MLDDFTEHPEGYSGLEDRSEELSELSEADIRIRFYRAMARVDVDDPNLVSQLSEAIASVMFDLCAIHLRTPGDGVKLVAAHDVNEALDARVEELIADEFVAQHLDVERIEALRSSGVAELSEGALFESPMDPSLSLQTHSVLIAGLRTTRGQPYGTIMVARHVTKRAYDSTDRALLQWVASHVAMKLETGRLNRDLRTKNRELEQKAAALEHAVRERDEFIAAAAHELKTPLSTLALQVELVRRELAAEPRGHVSEFEHNIYAMRRQVDRLNRLVGRLLDTSQLTAGELDFELRSIDLGAVSADVVERFRPHATQSQIELTLDAPTVIGQWDECRLDQVISNLVSNAIKYTTSKVHVWVEQRGDRAVFGVRDDGIGVPEEATERIFERFERAGNAKRSSGLGLGLWISKRIIERLGGTITVRSMQGSGSTFEVALPLASPPISSRDEDRRTVDESDSPQIPETAPALQPRSPQSEPRTDRSGSRERS